MPEREVSPQRRDRLDAALLAGIGGLFVAHALYLSGVAEDAFISFRFAQNWTSGYGLVWNPGEAPVEGYTNFLWLALMALLMLAGVDVVLGSQALGLAASLGVLWLSQRCALLLGWSRGLALLPPLALAVSGPFAAWATAGMETNFFALWLLLGAFSLARYERDRRGLDLHVGSASLLLACLTRPEGLLVSSLLLACLLFSVRRRPASTLRGILLRVLPWALLFLAYFVWRWLYFGYPLPNTFYAKTGGGATQLVRGLEYTALFTLHFLAPWVGVLILAWIGRGPQRRGPAPPSRMLLRASVLVVVAYTIYIALVGGDYMAMYRFFVPILPFVYLLLGEWTRRAWTGSGDSLRALVPAAVALALAGSLVHSTPLESRLFEEPEHMHGNWRGVELERRHVARNRLIGGFFARYGRPGESIATRAIGAVGFYSGLDVHDVHGIVDLHIAHLDGGELGAGLPGHEKSDYPYIFDKRPTFYVFNPRLFPEPFPGIPKLDDSVDARVAREYRVRSVELRDAVTGETGYFAFLERKDRSGTP